MNTGDTFEMVCRKCGAEVVVTYDTNKQKPLECPSCLQLMLGLPVMDFVPKR